MERRSFIGNAIALIGVAASAKAIASIGSNGKSVLIPSGVFTGDILLRGIDNKIFYFTGNCLKSINDEETIDDLLIDDSANDFAVFYFFKKRKPYYDV